MNKALFVVVLLLSLLYLCTAKSLHSNCGGNCVEANCKDCICGTTTDVVNITEVCAEFPAWDQECCRCITSKMGSQGNANAQFSHEDGTVHVGLWQIHSDAWGCSHGTAPCGVEKSMECAIDAWKRSGGSFNGFPQCEACGCKKPESKGKNTKPAKKKRAFIGVNQQSQLNETAGNCGGNCPGNDCSSCPCGSSPSQQNIQQVCSMYSGWDQTCCQCIVQHESGGNANAINENTNGSLDVGVWQINSVNWPSCSGNQAPCNVNTNLQCAIKVYQNGGNTFKQWSTCAGCGCCSAGGTTGSNGPASTAGHSTSGPATHSTNGPAATHSTDGPSATHSSSGTNGQTSTGSTYGAALAEAKLPGGGNGNFPLAEGFNLITPNKKK